MRGTLGLVGIGAEQAAGDLDTRGFGVGLAQQAALTVAVKLGELIAIDGRVEGRACRLVVFRPGERTQQRKQHEGRQGGEDDPQQHWGAVLLLREDRLRQRG